MSTSYPHDIAAERALLGCMLIAPDQRIKAVAALLRDVDFYLEKHRKIFGRILALYETHGVLDLVTVASSFRSDETLEEVGGLAYLSSLTDAPALSDNYPQYALIISEKARRRRLALAAEQAREAALDTTLSASEVEAAQAGVAAVSVRSSADEIIWSGDFARAGWGTIDEEEKARSGQIIIPTGFADLDHALGGGVRTTDLTLVAARPSMGKTAFALNMLTNAGRAGERGAFLSYEMTVADVSRRCIQMLAQEEPQEVADRMTRAAAMGAVDAAAEQAWVRLVNGATELSQLPVGCYDRRTQTIEEAVALMQQTTERTGCRLYFLDYLQQMRFTNPGGNPTSELGHIAKTAKAAAKDLNVAVVLLCQLNRKLEDREDKRPMMSDLRGSGEIEEAVDDVLFLYREIYYALKKRNAQLPAHAPRLEESDLPDLHRLAEVIIAKRRCGPGAGKTIPLRFHREHQLFASASFRR